MDKRVNVRLFMVVRGEDTETEFSAALNHIFCKELGDREYEVETGIIIRLERLSAFNNYICGEIIRRQTENLPPKAASGEPVQPLGVSAIGHSTVFVYDPILSVVALQLARNGITSTRLAMYIGAMASGASYDLLPAPTAEAWSKLTGGRVRA